MFFEMFFAPRDSVKYPPCGMFTFPHFIALFFTLALVGIGVFLCRNIDAPRVKKLTKIVAIVVTLLELTKIGYNFYFGYTWIDAWVPLAFCSLFIYACWFAGFGKGFLEKLGVGFMVGGCPTAGFLFLIFPTTSLQMHPIFHFLCLYSMLFHGLMVWLGLLHIFNSRKRPTWKTFGYYAGFFTCFASVALILNTTLSCNLMFLRQPFNIPLKFVEHVYQFSAPLYSILIFVAYLACFLVSLGLYSLVNFIKLKTPRNHNQIKENM